MSESISCATSAARPARFEAAQVTGDFAGRIGLRDVRHCLKAVEHVAAEADELLRGQIRRELLGKLQRMALPVAHHILILLAGARNIAALAIQIAEPEVRERERIVQIERAAQRLQRLVRGAGGAPRSCRAADARVARDRSPSTPPRPAAPLVEPAAMGVDAAEQQQRRHERRTRRHQRVERGFGSVPVAGAKSGEARVVLRRGIGHGRVRLWADRRSG